MPRVDRSLCQPTSGSGRGAWIDPTQSPPAAHQGAGTGAARRAPWRGEDGFSLVELTVVAAVIGLLLTIGLATFAGASEKAHGRAVQVELRTALETALLLAQESRGRFVVDEQPITPEDLHAAEPALAFAEIGQRKVIGVSVSADATTIRLDQLDDGGTRHTVVAESGRGFRFCAGVEPADCALDVDEVVAPSPDPSTVTTTAPGNSGGHRQDGTTPANDNRQNGR